MTDLVLQGKTAIVTGGARGIGHGIVMELAKAGADVLIADLDEEAMQSVAEDVKSLGRPALTSRVDVTDFRQVQAMVDQASREFGQIDIMVNNAGAISIKPVSELTERDWDFVMEVNAKGVFFGCKAVLPYMLIRKSGRIINVASVAGKEGFPHLAHYSASKFAVVGFTNALAKEVAQDGITVNAICPGIVRTYMWDRLADAWKQEDESIEDSWVSTYMWDRLADGWNREDKESVESWVRQLLAQIPQGHAQTPEDMGRLAVFLATMGNITGQSVNVDGGFASH